MKKLLFLFILFSSTQVSFAQKKWKENLAATRPQYEYKKPALKPVVVMFVEKDMAPKRHITKLLERILFPPIGGLQWVSGYKLMLFSDRDRKKVEEVKKKALQVFKEDVSLVYEQPFYRVKVGAYLNKQDADEAKKKARLHFEEAIVVPEKIKIFQPFEED